MVIRAGDCREAAEEPCASVAGGVCVEGPVPAARPKGECSERRRRTHVPGRTLKAEYLGAHGSRTQNQQAPERAEPSRGKAGPGGGAETQVRRRRKHGPCGARWRRPGGPRASRWLGWREGFQGIPGEGSAIGYLVPLSEPTRVCLDCTGAAAGPWGTEIPGTALHPRAAQAETR